MVRKNEVRIKERKQRNRKRQRKNEREKRTGKVSSHVTRFPGLCVSSNKGFNGISPGSLARCE